MSWFADLTPYQYTRHEDGRVRLNVGWLERGQPFDVGPTPIALAQRLASLAEHARAAQTRGLHPCDLCADEPEWDDYARMSGAEIRLVWGDTIFAAPTLIHHYVTDRLRTIGAEMMRSHVDDSTRRRGVATQTVLEIKGPAR